MLDAMFLITSQRILVVGIRRELETELDVRKIRQILIKDMREPGELGRMLGK